MTATARDVMPLIRFRTGDIAAIEKPECGYKLETMKHIVSRLEGSYSLTSGEIINPPILEEAILKVEEVSDYQVYIKENNQLYIKAETVDLEEPVNSFYQKVSFLQEMKPFLHSFYS